MTGVEGLMRRGDDGLSWQGGGKKLCWEGNGETLCWEGDAEGILGEEGVERVCHKRLVWVGQTYVNRVWAAHKVWAGWIINGRANGRHLLCEASGRALLCECRCAFRKLLDDPALVVLAIGIDVTSEAASAPARWQASNKH